MARHPLPFLSLVAVAGACSADAGPSPLPLPVGDPEASEVVFQAVDAGTGGVLTDPGLTVRYLVRSPITLDAAGVERVPAAEAIRLAQDVAYDSLVLELRLEAPSYHRLDTVLAVARGGSAGPFTVRMARRLDRGAPPPGAAAAGGVPSGSGAAPAAADPDAGVDRSALDEGDRAFRAGDWVKASMAYERMAEPAAPTGAYAREYQEALVRRGTAHLRLGEYGGAMEALEKATSFPGAGATAHLLLGQAQCAVGRTEAGRETLTRLERRAGALPGGDVALVMVDYVRGVCSQGQVDLARTTMDLVRAGGQAVRELEGFIQKAEAMSPRPPAVQEALDDARRRVEAIRAKVRRGAGG